MPVVMCGRHDDERGDFSGRLQNSIDVLLYQARQFGVRMEVIVVEQNPFPGAPNLVSLLRVPLGAYDDLAVRVIRVKPEFHARVEGQTGQSFFEYCAQNVGARRARGKFVLSSNPDVLFSDALAEMLSKEAELPRTLDPLAPLDMRSAALEELVHVLWEENTCERGWIDCPGENNRGVCESGEQGSAASDGGLPTGCIHVAFGRASRVQGQRHGAAAVTAAGGTNPSAWLFGRPANCNWFLRDLEVVNTRTCAHRLTFVDFMLRKTIWRNAIWTNFQKDPKLSL